MPPKNQEAVPRQATCAEASPAVPTPQFVGVAAFAKMTSSTASTVRGWIAAGMPAVRVDRHWRIDVVRAVRWMRKARRRG